MNENDPLQNNPPENKPKTETEILTDPFDPSVVVVDEEKRTVLLTEDQTLIIEKDPVIESVPKNRARNVYAGMWGPTEIGAVGVASLALLAMLVFYVFVVMRSNDEVEKNRAERNRLETELASSKAKYGDMSNTQVRVEKLKNSVEDFETRFLPIASIGQTALYQRINGLIAANNLVNTTGPNYVPLEVADPKRPESDEEKGKSKFKSLFPGVYISMTVEGPYQNIRRFISEMETTEQFVVLSTVELEPADAPKKEKQPGAPPEAGTATVGINNPMGPNFPNPNGGVSQGAAEQVKGKTHGESVSLRLEMAAYFRRPNFAPQVNPEAAAQ